MLKLKGNIIEIGNLEDGSGRGIRINRGDDSLVIIGLTEDECRSAVKLFDLEVEIIISGINDAIQGESE